MLAGDKGGKKKPPAACDKAQKKRKVTIVASPLQKVADDHCTNWLPICITSVLSFSSAAQYNLYFSSLWPYIKKIDPTLSEHFLGYTIAIYSVGQIISSPLFGYWSNRLKRVRFLIIVGFIFMLAGNMVYMVLELFHVYYRGALIIVSRLLLGIGSGNVVLLRSYAATSPAPKDRTRAIAFITCGQALGLTGGPAIQLLFTMLDYPGQSLFVSHLRLNLYTAPAYFSILMNLMSVVAMQTMFHENYAGLLDETASTSNVEAARPKIRLPPFDLIAISVCLVTRFTYIFINSNLETIGSPYSMMMFSWVEDLTVYYTSIAQGLVGALTLLTYVLYILLKIEQWLNLRIASICALLLLNIFHLVTYSWPFLPGHVNITHGSGTSSVGCNADKFDWCETLRPVNVWLYYIAYILALGLAFPILNIGNTTLYSDVLGPRRQGTMQGILQMAGGTARLVGPIVMSFFYSAYGPVMAWNMEVLVITATIVLWLSFYGRILPSTPSVVEKAHSISVVDVVPDLSAPSSLVSSHGESQINSNSVNATPVMYETKVPSKRETPNTPLLHNQ